MLLSAQMVAACPNLSGTFELAGEEGGTSMLAMKPYGCEKIEIVESYVGGPDYRNDFLLIIDGVSRKLDKYFENESSGLAVDVSAIYEKDALIVKSKDQIRTFKLDAKNNLNVFFNNRSDVWVYRRKQ